MKRIYTSCLGYKKILLLSLFLLSSTNSNAQCYDEWDCFWQNWNNYWDNYWNDWNYSNSFDSATELGTIVVSGERSSSPSTPISNPLFDTYYVNINDFAFGLYRYDLGAVYNYNFNESLIEPTKKDAEDNKKKEPTIEERIAKAFDASKIDKLNISYKDITEDNTAGIQKAEISVLFTTSSNNKYGLTSKLDSNSNGQQLSGKWEGSIAGNETKMTYDNSSKNFTINFGSEGKSGVNLSTNFNNVYSTFTLGDSKGSFVSGKFDSNGNFGGSVGLGNQTNNISAEYGNNGSFTGNVTTNIFNNTDVSLSSTLSVLRSPTDSSIGIGINLTNK